MEESKTQTQTPTPIDASAPSSSWLSDLEIDTFNIFPKECDLNFLDKEEFNSHDIAGALNKASPEETGFDLERPSKLPKTVVSSSSCNSSTIITKTFSPDLSPSPSSISSFHSQILSFDNSTQFRGFDSAFDPTQNEMTHLGNKHFPTQTPNGSSKNLNFERKTSLGKRSPARAHDHIMSERKRREKLSQSFIALGALVPGLKKMDKASVLRDATKYVKELKERLAVLEEQSKKAKAESVVVLSRTELDDSSSSCEESIDANESLFQVEARVSGQEILLRIICQKRKGLVVKILAEIQSLNLFVQNSSVLPFGDSIIDITVVAQMGEGYNLSIKEVMKKLRLATLKLM